MTGASIASLIVALFSASMFGIIGLSILPEMDEDASRGRRATMAFLLFVTAIFVVLSQVLR